MRIYQSHGIKTIDTSTGRANDVVDQLSEVSQGLRELSIVTKELATDKNKDTDSPYLSDRPSFDPTRIKGTELETEWKTVGLSQQSDLKELQDQYKEEKVKYVQDLKKKLNII
ncbi:hypothetical protein A9Q84_18315 [Halobacteriovorax marinus]|uniref:Uncharacterized protein n=1 Tax=Halobacteriovorax marinus TaxID=97084 RepID=A0A1Y5F3K4_9BACT|nr:hypothetical protein A9Q84_18315 [Halobacteriovorax marinus]